MAYTPPKPNPEGNDRKDEARRRRDLAAGQSADHVPTTVNGEAADFENIWPTSYSKGLPHYATGLVEPNAFRLLYDAINAPDFDFEVPLAPCRANKAYRPPKGYNEDPKSVENFIADPNADARSWESPVAGHVYDLEGPDAGSVAMAPAPRLGSDELVAEMAEDYAMALLRDTPFEALRQGDSDTDNIVGALNKLPWFDIDREPVGHDGSTISAVSDNRRKVRFANGETCLSRQSLFRGSSKGCMDGPYISQFLLIGNKSRSGKRDTSKGKGYETKVRAMIEVISEGQRKLEETSISDGRILYGAQMIDQRVDAHRQTLDYMTDWASWLDVQNGADYRNRDKFEQEHFRFITTPRDLATYVHFDALYQAYLNACLLMLSANAKLDSGFPEGGDHKTRAGFATFGGPHILTLVTETATRSLKAVRRQKYNYHLRARPEYVGAIAALSASGLGSSLGTARSHADRHVGELLTAKTNSFSLLEAINAHNAVQNQHPDRDLPVKPVDQGPDIDGKNYLLPMAFPEGSPMHPAYGAGHATVAGSCVTILKAFFEMYGGHSEITFDKIGDGSFDTLYVPVSNGETLTASGEAAASLTLQGELNKLAANISIGRNMAGVHYYSDYFNSLRMGERIAVGMLQEQMATYPEPMTMTFDSFDGDRIILGADGNGGDTMSIGGSSAPADIDAWWKRHI